MQWVMLCCATGGIFAQNVLMKAFTNGKRLSLFSVVLYNLLLACGALALFFLAQAATGTAVAFHLPTVLYALAFPPALPSVFSFLRWPLPVARWRYPRCLFCIR